MSARQSRPLRKEFNSLVGTHDVSLPAWGPYTKRYIGISHLPDMASGVRVDFSLMPGLYRREASVPNVKWESGYHPWLATPDFRFYRHRHELLWKDRLYAEIDFCRLDDNAVLAACTFVNTTSDPQNAVLQTFAWVNLPPSEWTDDPVRPARLELPSGALWVGAESYADLTFQDDFPQRSLAWDGQRHGEFRYNGFTGGFALGTNAMRHGARLRYALALPHAFRRPVMLMRAWLPNGGQARVRLEGLGLKQELVLAGGSDLFVQRVELGSLAAGAAALHVTSLSGDVLVLDGFALVEADAAEAVRWVQEPLALAPQRLESPANTLMLKFADAGTVYGLAWDGALAHKVREFVCRDLDCTVRKGSNDSISDVLRGGGEGHFTNVFQRPLFLSPKSKRTLYSLLCNGTEADVRERLAAFEPAAPATAARHAAAARQATSMRGLPSGKPYRFSQERMAATMLTNVVYPIRTRGSWIRHYTPGRWWDCLYTWDSGFVALGLAELDLNRAVDCLNAYVTEPGDDSAAFIHHGTPVPVQFHTFLEIWNRTSSRALAAHFFPRLRQYHNFLVGRHGSSTTRNLKSNLLRTWDYFYNSGGWDDYPPQMAVHAQALTASVAPVANTAHAIRTAKILKSMAETLGEDATEFDADIATFTEALQQWSWDPEAGYFSYVMHDAQGRPTGPLRHESGQNYNMGLDGAAPLLAGICTEQQERQIVEHLMTPGRLWCKCGLSTVDQSAAYYRHDGYWNGAVWMPHQWFMWKALLDLGATDAAWKIASTGLEVWKTEVERSYHCFEHFIVETGRGAGWHQFGGLSSPVLAWYSAYHRPGRLTTGYDVMVRASRFEKGGKALQASLSLCGQARHTPAVIVTLLAEVPRYRARWNDQELPVHARLPGVLEIRLPSGAGVGELSVLPA
jgi:hypothetical protein